MRTLTIAIGVALCAGDAAQGRAAERALSQYIRDRWEADKGFPGGRVHAIAQTSDGYLWIGAEKGLVRFDGLTFRLFEPNRLANRPPNWIGPTVLGAAGASDGSLWARLRGPALVRYRDGAMEDILPLAGPPESVVSAMTPGLNGSMLVATLGRGAMVHRQDRFDRIAPSTLMPIPSFVIALAETATGDFWLGTRDAGLLRVQEGRVSRVTEGLPDLKINCLLPADGEVWIGTDKGVVRWTAAGITSAGIPADVQRLPALTMIRDRNSNVWIAGGASGLRRVDPSGQVMSADGLPQVSAAFEDRDGNLWIGTDRGIERWRDPMFATHSTAQGLPSDAIGPLFVDAAGRTWFAPTAGGLYWLRDGVVGHALPDELDPDVVYSIAGSGDDVWIGRQRGGLTRIRVEGARLSAKRYTRADGLAQDSVYTVHRARDGAIWAGTLSAGVSRFAGGSFVSYDTTHGLASNTVATIVDTADGNVWLGTPNGLSVLSKGAWRTYTAREGLPSNDINTLFEDKDRNLWVGTSAGLAVIAGGRVHAVEGGDVTRGPVLGLAQDRTGLLWIAMADHILRARPEPLLQGAARDGDLQEFANADGLLALEGVKRHRTVVADGAGRIWFALNRGISVADPTRADDRRQPALAHVESISADGSTIDLRSSVSIPSSRRRITFEYAGLSLSVPERVRFRYRLDGFDPDWSDPVSARQAVYTNLKPGPYRFRVMASNSDGAWSGSEAAVPVQIQPMLWQTGWFQIAAAIAAAAAGWGVYRLRVRKVAQQISVRFEERLAERTHIARELHDTLLQGFISASMQLHVAVDRMPDESPAKETLRRVLELMTRITEEGRNAVRGLRAPGSTAEALETAFSGIAAEVGDGRADFRVIVEGRARPLAPVARDEIYRIGREALTNAFRHSGAGHVELELDYAPHELRVFVRDDGRGIDPRVLEAGADGHWGLAGMRERADRIGATLKIRSRAAAGTEVELRVPGHAAFEGKPSTVRPSRRGRWFTRVRAAANIDEVEKQP